MRQGMNAHYRKHLLEALVLWADMIVLKVAISFCSCCCETTEIMWRKIRQINESRMTRRNSMCLKMLFQMYVHYSYGNICSGADIISKKPHKIGTRMKPCNEAILYAFWKQARVLQNIIHMQFWNSATIETSTWNLNNNFKIIEHSVFPEE